MLIPLALTRADSAVLHRFFHDRIATPVALEKLLSEEGQQKWGLVLQLNHPVLSTVHVRSQNPETRGQWMDIAGTLALATQARIVHREQAPVICHVFEALPASLSFESPTVLKRESSQHVLTVWLDHLAQAFQQATPEQQKKAHTQASLSHRLTGPAWALLSGRASARDLVTPADLAP